MNDALIYLRVSTKEQGKSGVGADAQEDACRAWCLANERIVAGVHSDLGKCGDKPPAERPGLLAALAELGKGDVLIVRRRDRISRGGSVAMAAIERLASVRGARIVSAAGEGTESDTPENEFLRDIFDAVSKLELHRIRQRTKEGHAAKAKRGENCGSVQPYGWELDPDGPRNDRGRPVRLKPVPFEQNILAMIRSKLSQGKTVRQITRHLNRCEVPTKRGRGLWRYSTLYGIVARINKELPVETACQAVPPPAV